MSQSFVTTNPTTEETLTKYTYLTTDQAERAVENCHIAFQEWRHVDLTKRADIIRAIGAELQNRRDDLAKLMTQEMGKLLEQSYQEIDLCTAVCDWTADNGPQELKPEKRPLEDGLQGHIVKSPIGVIYGIQPWNYPAYQVVRYSIANLMAGNGVLLKHAANVTGTGKMLAEIYEAAGLPENLFTAIIITHDQSDDVIKNELVRGVTLTGSSEAGRYVGQKAAAALKKTVLELGSNDAYIVLADAELESAVENCVNGRIYNNGETCIAAKRFIVVDDIYDDFKTAFVKAMGDITIGDPMSDKIDMGPMAREDLRDGLHEQVLKSVELGAEILCGGQKDKGKGYFYPATVLANVSPGQPAYDDELFGPVASLIRAVDTDDAMRIANDSKFGLGGGIMTTDTDKALEMASAHFDTGMVFINGFGLAAPNMPFGGVKDSGFGREHGGYGLTEFVNHKSVFVKSEA